MLSRVRQARRIITEKHTSLSKALGRPARIVVVSHKIFSVCLLSKSFKGLREDQHISEVELGDRNFPSDGKWLNNVEAVNADEYIF